MDSQHFRVCHHFYDFDGGFVETSRCAVTLTVGASALRWSRSATLSKQNGFASDNNSENQLSEPSRTSNEIHVTLKL